MPVMVVVSASRDLVVVLIMTVMIVLEEVAVVVRTGRVAALAVLVAPSWWSTCG